MKPKLIFGFVAVLLVGAVLYGYLQAGKERSSDTQDDQPVASQSRVATGTNGEPVVDLSAKAQHLVDLKTTVLQPATLAPRLTAYGRVLDPSLLVGLLSRIASARASLDASAKQYQRLNALFEHGGNASVRTLQTAEAAMKHDRIALDSARAQLVASWGTAIAGQPDLDAFVDSLATLKTVLVRLDLPAGELASETPTRGKVLAPGTDRPIPARFLGPAPTTEPVDQGQGFLLVLTNGPVRFSPGLAVAGLLELPGAPLQGVIVPESAVVRAAERTWVFVQTGPTTFTRRELSHAHPVPGGWFVASGLIPNDRIVTTGAQTLLSEERKSEIQVDD